MFVVFHNIVRFKPVHSIVCSYDHRSPREAWLSNGSIPHRISSEVTSFRNEESQKSIYQSMAGGGAAGVNAGNRGDGGAGGDEGDESDNPDRFKKVYAMKVVKKGAVQSTQQKRLLMSER